MTIVVGKTYFGPNEERKTVTAVSADRIDFRYPTSGIAGWHTPDVFEGWRLESERRSYVGPNGDRRVRLRIFESSPAPTELGSGETGELEPVVPEPETMVEYVTPDAPGVMVTVSWDDWAAWRATAA